MLSWTLLAGFIQFTPPRTTPPGNVWTLLDTVSVAALLIGAILAGRRGLSWFDASILGAIGAACFDVWLPDSRDFLAMAMRTGPQLSSFVAAQTVFIVAVGVTCGTTAAIAARWWAAREEVGGSCPKCGYDLRGLPEPRCPECGAAVDPSAIRSAE